LNSIPAVASYLRERFAFVFVDEMQDMERHQHDLLEMLFYIEGGSCCYQRIGDINQCIFGEHSSSMEEVWQERENSLTISGSHRLHQSAAKIVQPFGAKKSVPIIGLGQNTRVTPHLIVYTSESIRTVIPTFGELILRYCASGDISAETKYPIKIIGWNGKPSEDGKLRIRDYYPDYQPSVLTDRIDFPNLLSYLTFYDNDKETLEAVRKNILNGILRLLRIDNLTLGDRYFTKRTFINHLKYSHPEIYEEFQETLYYACISCVRGQTNLAHHRLIEFIPGLIRAVFAAEITNDGQYFLSNLSMPSLVNTGVAIPNVVNYKSLLMSVGTVHSVKGETHMATLYLDTCYHKLESEKSINQLIGKDACLEKQSRKLESAKMMYVGFSRATDLLCYAVEDGRLNEHEDQLIQAGWKIVRV
jgi:DNA helicase-2/ATP-dependent DNA helicase PcrA